MELINLSMSTKNDRDKRKRTSENFACVSSLVFIRNRCISSRGIKPASKLSPWKAT